MELRDYQQDLVEGVRREISAGHRRILIQLACGGGKTAIASYILQNTIRNNFNAIAMAHRFELCSQFSKTLTNFDVPHGMIQSGVKPNYSLPMQVASIGTLKNRLDKTLLPKILIIDEAAHIAAKTWKLIEDYYYDLGAIIIGLSATPCRLSGEPLSDCFDVMVQGPTIKQLTEWGFLCRYRYYAPKQVMDLSTVKINCGDYAKDELEIAVNRSVITGDCILHYQKLLPGKRAIVFCVSIAHAEAVAGQFNGNGIHAEAVSGNTSVEDRKAALERFKSGQTLVLTNCDIYSEGTDIPSVEGVILLRPTCSLALFVQQTGRALRPDPDNPCKVAVLLDHCGNVFKHDLPDTEHQWSLDGKIKRKKNNEPTVGIRQCPQCYYVHPPKPICPGCGHVYQMTARQLAEEAGTLVEFTAMEKKSARMQVGMAKTISDLKEIAAARGYKSGWVWQMAKLKGIKK